MSGPSFAWSRFRSKLICSASRFFFLAFGQRRDLRVQPPQVVHVAPPRMFREGLGELEVHHPIRLVFCSCARTLVRALFPASGSCSVGGAQAVALDGQGCEVLVPVAVGAITRPPLLINSINGV